MLTKFTAVNIKLLVKCVPRAEFSKRGLYQGTSLLLQSYGHAFPLTTDSENGRDVAQSFHYLAPWRRTMIALCIKRLPSNTAAVDTYALTNSVYKSPF